MRASPVIIFVATLGILGCAPESSSQEEPPLQASEIYRIIPTLCHEKCWTLTLYRSGTFIELRAHQPYGEFLGRATGSLSEPANEELDQLLEVVDLGELPGIMSHDAPLVELWLPGLHLIYDDGYPPSGLIEIDAFLATVLDDMSQCRPTTRVTPEQDCEPLNWFPE